MTIAKGSHIHDVSLNPLYHKQDFGELDAARPLPTPTKDFAALVQDLAVHGYCMIAEALGPDEVGQLRERIDTQWEAEARAGVGRINQTGVHTTCNLLNKGKIFQNVALNSPSEDVLGHLLGEDYLVSAMCALQTVPGTKAQGLHIDQFLFGVRTEFPLVANAFFMIDEFTEDNGATRIIPGSHRWSEERVVAAYEGLGIAGQGDGGNPAGTIAATGPAGTCFVFEGRLLHGAGHNRTTDKKRTAISAYYCRPWMRPFENAFLSIPDAMMETFPTKLRARLGYKTWGLAGGYQAPGVPASLDIVKPTDQVGELHL